VFRAVVVVILGAFAAAGAYVLAELGYFAPLGARIRGLFLVAVKTGNPLVDSVAEHRPSSPQAYEHYLGETRFLAVVGVLFCWHQKNASKSLALIYALVAYHYSLKMSRLIIVCGPIVSVLAGYPIGIVADWCIEQMLGFFSRPTPLAAKDETPVRTGGMGSIWRTMWCLVGRMVVPLEFLDVVKQKNRFGERCAWLDRPLRLLVAAAIVVVGYRSLEERVATYSEHCESYAESASSPRIMFKSPMRDGSNKIVDDYYRGYLWIKENTPADARIMAWWDYGYQITGVANRTSIADGNTWNHEHIATLGKILTSPAKKSYNAQRHLTDYVLVWAGGRSDDMAKSPHLARIGNSVFPDHCGDADPLCRNFGFYEDRKPTPMMAESFLYKAVSHGIEEGVTLSSKYWEEVHTTQHGLMRVYKVLNVSMESKAWCADPANRICDAPGSWYCVGQYPPAIQKLIAQRKAFTQLEDFNMKGERRAKSAYTNLIEKQMAEGNEKEL